MNNETERLNAVEEIDSALQQDDLSVRERSMESQIETSDPLPRVLRTTGALAIIASAITFMAQGWSDWGMVLRHFAFLGVTMSLAAGGIIAGIKVREDKGARTFLTLALAMIPVHFTQMGGMVYSLFGRAPAGMPEYFTFVAPGIDTVLLVTAVTVPLTVVVAFMGYSVLARSHALLLTALYTLGNCMFLIPARNQWQVMGMAAVLTIALVFFDRRVLYKDPTTHNLEGGLVRLSLFTPVMLLLFRNLYYVPDCFFFALIFGVVGTVFFQLVPVYLARGGKLEISMQVFGAANYMLAGGFLAHGLVGHVSSKITVAACILALITSHARNNASFSRVVASVLLGIGVLYGIIETFVNPNIWVAAWLVAASVGISAVGFYQKELFPSLAGIACALVSLANLCYQAVVRLHVDVWVSLAAVGLVILSAAIYLEKSGKLRLSDTWRKPPKEKEPTTPCEVTA